MECISIDPLYDRLQGFEWQSSAALGKEIPSLLLASDVTGGGFFLTLGIGSELFSFRLSNVRF